MTPGHGNPEEQNQTQQPQNQKDKCGNKKVVKLPQTIKQTQILKTTTFLYVIFNQLNTRCRFSLFSVLLICQINSLRHFVGKYLLTLPLAEHYSSLNRREMLLNERWRANNEK